MTTSEQLRSMKQFRKSQTRMRGVLIVVLPMLLMVWACEKSPGTQEASVGDTTVRVTVATPNVETLTESITLSGAVVAEEQVTVYAKVTGYLETLNVDLGDRVRKGQQLAAIEVPEMAASLEEKKAALIEAEAGVDEAKAQVGQHSADLEFRRSTLKRLAGIRERDKDVLAQQDVDQAAARVAVAESHLRSAQAKVRVADAAVTSRRAALETMNRLAEYTTISAPISGVVTERFVDPGALIQAASSSRTQAAPLVSLARTDRVRVVVDVPETGAAFVNRGTPATIEIVGGDSIAGKVSRTSGALSADTRTLRAECDLPNPGGRLKPGMTARVTLELRQLQDSITVPVEALQGDGVYVVEGGKAVFRNVTVGLQVGDRVRIEAGLLTTDSVVVSSSAPLANEMPVTNTP